MKSGMPVLLRREIVRSQRQFIHQRIGQGALSQEA